MEPLEHLYWRVSESLHPESGAAQRLTVLHRAARRRVRLLRSTNWSAVVRKIKARAVLIFATPCHFLLTHINMMLNISESDNSMSERRIDS